MERRGLGLLGLLPAMAGRARLPFVDIFGRADGAIGNGWVGPTWTIAGGKAVNTPVLGVEKIVNGNFAAWTGDNPDSWGVTGESGSDPMVTEVTGQARVYTSSSLLAMLQSVLTANKFYHVSMDIKAAVAGFLRFAVGAGSSVGPVHGTTGVKRMTHLAAVTDIGIRRHSGATDYTIDDFTVKEIPVTQLFATREFRRAGVDASVKLTLVETCRSGLVLNLDSVSAPANFVTASHDGAAARLVKCVAGTYTELINAAATYSAGAALRVVKSGATTYQLWYNGSQVGTDQTVSDAGIISNTKHGLFSTYEGNTLDDFSIVAV